MTSQLTRFIALRGTIFPGYYREICSNRHIRIVYGLAMSCSRRNSYLDDLSGSSGYQVIFALPIIFSLPAKDSRLMVCHSGSVAALPRGLFVLMFWAAPSRPDHMCHVTVRMFRIQVCFSAQGQLQRDTIQRDILTQLCFISNASLSRYDCSI